MPRKRTKSDFDPKRKGIIMFCGKCNKKTRQVPYASDDKQVQEFDENKVKVSKLHHFVCSECGGFNSRDRW
jgi:hypothetical protein